MRIKELNKREKILAFVVGALLSLLIFNLLIFQPISYKINTIRKEISQAQLAIRKYSEIVEHKEGILKAQKQIERYLSLKGNDEEKIAAILSKIESEARKVNLSILDMSPQPSGKSGSALQIYQVQLRAEANMKGIVDFIYGLENADILFKIDKLDLSMKDEAAKTIRMDVRILGLSFS